MNSRRFEDTRSIFNKFFDPEFRTRVKENPAEGAKELGYRQTEGIKFVVKQSTSTTTYLAINNPRDLIQPLNNDELQSVQAAIGAGTIGTVACVSTAASVGSVCLTFSSASSGGSLSSVGTVDT